MARRIPRVLGRDLRVSLEVTKDDRHEPTDQRLHVRNPCRAADQRRLATNPMMIPTAAAMPIAAHGLSCT